MALSNILREPRREITETLVGVGIVGAIIFADYVFGRWATSDGLHSLEAGMVLGLALAAMVAAALAAIVALAVGFHALGEATCNTLQRHGIHIRPRERH